MIWSSATPTHTWAGRLGLQPNPTLPSGPHHFRTGPALMFEAGAQVPAYWGVTSRPSASQCSPFLHFIPHLAWGMQTRLYNYHMDTDTFFFFFFFGYRPNTNCKWSKPSSQLPVTQMCFLPDPPSGSGSSPPTRHPPSHLQTSPQ